MAPDAVEQPGATTPKTFTETVLTIEIKLTLPTEALPTTTLDITARDGTTPVITDLWLFNIADDGTQVPLTGFTSTARRRVPRFMLPATVNGQPTGWKPADNGVENGLMTGTSRGTMKQGAFIAAITGTVTVTLPAPPTQPILVVAALEDQRYAGAAVITATGDPGTVPQGVGQPETHMRLSWARDVASINQPVCGACHNPTFGHNTFLRKTAGTREELVNDNFGYASAKFRCEQMFPADAIAKAKCIRDITSSGFLVEPGAPAISSWLSRSRPDEEGNASPNGIAWWGSTTAANPRYNTDYGDRRMPSTMVDPDPTHWTNQPTYFDRNPDDWYTVWQWVAQGAAP
jgi:hypothetical protein